ncbi:Uncharacterised protein [Pseudomonas putida]|nr:Uncharacterised protein [Pseudomonas putida]CAB5523895.1 Uncharacterised protein [Pseudomonas putida]CAB5561187.1 Uncharacterised protein [Pseudomonas putida]CAB5561909.1 Uncharacterised protein [Pseudomonas putida]CAB5649170.1 Uncharacterised protein [Pseudomonas putida]
MNRASIMALLDTVLLRSWRIGADPIVASTVLTADQLGHVVVDATAGAVAVTLPSASAALGGVEVTLRRKDVTTNVLSIVASGADKIVLPGDANGIAATELLFPGDYLTLRSDGAGKWWCVGQAQLPGSIDSGLVVFSAAGVSTYTVPAVLRSGRRVAKVTVIGGGGGGGRSGTAGVGSGGGGGGGVAKARCNLAGVTSVSVTVGAKGLGATVNNGQGTTGGTSSFGGFASATGGVGGAGNSTVQNAGGNTGVGVGGDILSGLGSGTGSFGSDGGIGGGPGFRSNQSATPGAPATMAGGGGSGAQSGQNGGNGADGEVALEW